MHGANQWISSPQFVAKIDCFLPINFPGIEFESTTCKHIKTTYWEVLARQSDFAWYIYEQQLSIHWRRERRLTRAFIIFLVGTPVRDAPPLSSRLDGIRAKRNLTNIFLNENWSHFLLASSSEHISRPCAPRIGLMPSIFMYTFVQCFCSFALCAASVFIVSLAVYICCHSEAVHSFLRRWFCTYLSI